MLATTVLLVVVIGILAALDARARRRLRLDALRDRAQGPRPEPRSSAVRIIRKAA